MQSTVLHITKVMLQMHLQKLIMLDIMVLVVDLFIMQQALEHQSSHRKILQQGILLE